MFNIIVALVSFLGLIIGWLIKKYTKEEIKVGEKYFKWLVKTIVLVLVVVLIYFDFNYYLLALGILMGFFIRNSYLYFGFVVGDFFISSLVFIFGLGYSTLRRYDKIFLIISFALFLLGFLIANIYKTNVYYSFVAGALLWRLIDVIPNKFRII